MGYYHMGTTMNNGAAAAATNDEELFNQELEFTPETFKAFCRVMRIRNDELARLIKIKYADVFHDLKGVRIQFVYGKFVTEFYFENNNEPVPEGKIKNLENLSSPTISGSNLFLKNRQLQHRVNGEKFTLTEQTKILLADVMYGGKDNNKPNSKKWLENVTEICTPVPANPFYTTKNAAIVMVRVGGIDLNRVLRKVFGTKMVIQTEQVKTDDGVADANTYAEAWYRPKFDKIVPGSRTPEPLFTINIDQFDKGQAVEMTINENPMMAQHNGVSMY